MAYLSDLQTVKIQRGGATVELVGGSFRGVTFFVESHQFGTGRRVAVHEFPGRDQPFNEDMGRSARSVNLDAYLLGEDVKAQKYALLEALEKPGTGTLVHPYMGQRLAKCTGLNITESATEKRRVGLSLTFALDPDPASTPAANVTTDPKSTTILRATAGQETTAAAFTKSFSLVGAAKFVATQARNLTNTLLDQVESARDSMRTASEFVDQLHQVRTNVDLLLLAPSEFARRVQLLLTSAEGAVLPSNRITARPLPPIFGGPPENDPTPRLARAQLEENLVLTTSGSSNPAVSPTTASRRQQATNQTSLLLLVRCGAAFAVASTLSTARVDSLQDAANLQARVLAAFDGLLDIVEDPDLFQALQSCLAAALGYLQDTSANLAAVESITPNRTVPSPVLAFERYGDTGMASDLVARNGTPHPGFIQGAVALEVLAA